MTKIPNRIVSKVFAAASSSFSLLFFPLLNGILQMLLLPATMRLGWVDRDPIRYGCDGRTRLGDHLPRKF